MAVKGGVSSVFFCDIFSFRSAASCWWSSPWFVTPRMQKESSGAGAVVATVGCSVLGMMLAGQGCFVVSHVYVYADDVGVEVLTCFFWEDECLSMVASLQLYFCLIATIATSRSYLYVLLHLVCSKPRVHFPSRGGVSCLLAHLPGSC